MLKKEEVEADKDIVLIKKDLETVKALVNALREMKHDDQERFQKYDEKIGELRNMLFDKEQELKDLRLQVGKAIDLVNQAQIEKVLVEKKKGDARISLVEAKLESNKALVDQMMLEIKSVRTKIEMYKGVEQVMALNEEVKRSLHNTNTIKADIDRHADKMEGMFINFMKKYDEFRNSRTELVTVSTELQKNIKKVNKIEVDMVNIAKNSDVDALREELAEKLKFADEYKNKFDQLLLEIADKSRVAYIDSSIRRMGDDHAAAIELLRRHLIDLRNKVMTQDASFNHMSHVLNQWIAYLNSRYGTTHNQTQGHVQRTHYRAQPANNAVHNIQKL